MPRTNPFGIAIESSSFALGKGWDEGIKRPIPFRYISLALAFPRKRG